MLLLAVSFVACEPASVEQPEYDTATRIVTLAPHLAELVFAAGAGDRLAGVSAFSDYPDAATELPVIGDAFTVDQEQLALLAPDLLLAWKSGTPAHVVDELRVAGYRVEVVDTHGLASIAAALLQIGELAGVERTARASAKEFQDSIAALQQKFSLREPVRVFFQVSERPLYTINGDHYIGEVLGLCGGHNIFSDLNELAPAVTVEAVIDRDPEVLLAGSADGQMPFNDWQRWPNLTANRLGNHFIVSADQIGRPTPRVVLAAADICDTLDLARGRLRDDQKKSRS